MGERKKDGESNGVGKEREDKMKVKKYEENEMEEKK